MCKCRLSIPVSRLCGSSSSHRGFCSSCTSTYLCRRYFFQPKYTNTPQGSPMKKTHVRGLLFPAPLAHLLVADTQRRVVQWILRIVVFISLVLLSPGILIYAEITFPYLSKRANHLAAPHSDTPGHHPAVVPLAVHHNAAGYRLERMVEEIPHMEAPGSYIFIGGNRAFCSCYRRYSRRHNGKFHIRQCFTRLA